MKMSNKKIPNIITRPLPNGVTYNLSTPGRVHITLPTNSTWTSGLHWHETHTEYLCLVKGSIWVQLNDRRDIFTVKKGESAEVEVPPYTWHEWGRASLDGDDVEVVERTDPEDDDKAVFFWNLNGVILDAPKMLNNAWLARLPPRVQGLFLDLWIPLNLFVIFRNLDNVPVFLNAQKLLSVSNADTKARLRRIDVAVSHLVLWMASWVGWVVGLQPVQTRYTPDVEYAEWHIRQRKYK